MKGLKYIQKNKEDIRKNIDANLQVINDILGINSKSLIIPIEIADNKKVLEIQKKLKSKGFLVGAIRQPTVKSAIIRLIAKIDVSSKELAKVCEILKELR